MELMVVMFVSTVILTALIVQQNKWSDQLAVNTQAYEFSLMLRQAQIDSLAVKEYSAGTADKFAVGYGIHLQFDPANYADPVVQYIYFIDKDNDQKYDAGDGESLQVVSLTKGVVMEKICYVNTSGGETCSSTNGNYRQLEVTFFRPEPKARILFLNNGGNTFGANTSKARIYLKSKNNKRASVTVENNGQISVING